ncbi:MAG TPA: hypothetical protein VHB21_14370, partial [Minicystis sp.]|nr:hypothetical protein [Minicystis sp.]
MLASIAVAACAPSAEHASSGTGGRGGRGGAGGANVGGGANAGGAGGAAWCASSSASTCPAVGDALGLGGAVAWSFSTSAMRIPIGDFDASGRLYLFQGADAPLPCQADGAAGEVRVASIATPPRLDALAELPMQLPIWASSVAADPGGGFYLGDVTPGVRAFDAHGAPRWSTDLPPGPGLDGWSIAAGPDALLFEVAYADGSLALDVLGADGSIVSQRSVAGACDAAACDVELEGCSAIRSLVALPAGGFALVADSTGCNRIDLGAGPIHGRALVVLGADGSLGATSGLAPDDRALVAADALGDVVLL